jgi:hypothetical protein
MDNERFKNLVIGELNRCKAILDTKGLDYTTTDDRLANFKDNAKNLNLTVRQSWAVFFYKHISAILTWARGGELKSESITSRFHDAINYLLLGLAIMTEEEENKKKQEENK